jgi:rare lipoprotein A
MFGPAGRGDGVPPSPDDDDELRPRAQVPRRRLAFALSATLAAVPFLVLDNLPASADERHEEEPISEVRREATVSTEAAVDDLDPTSTVAVTPPPSPTTSAAPSTSAETAETAERATTTTTEAPTTTMATTTTTKPRPTQTGHATWYAQPSTYPANGCAHPSLPFGTEVAVTNRANGRSAMCRVNDRGPFASGRIIDLDDDVFARIASLESGVISVSITW